MAKLQYEADGRVTAADFIRALTDFSERRPELWPDLSARLFLVHELGDTWADATEGSDVLGAVWARERYDWSTPGIVRLTLRDSADFVPGTVIEYHVTDTPGGCHVAVDFQRIARSPRGRLVGVLVQLVGARQFATSLRTALDRVATLEAELDT